jgi:hypothetical protein
MHIFIFSNHRYFIINGNVHFLFNPNDLYYNYIYILVFNNIRLSVVRANFISKIASDTFYTIVQFSFEARIK